MPLQTSEMLLYGGAVLAMICWGVMVYRLYGEDRAVGIVVKKFPLMAPFWALFHFDEHKGEVIGFVVAGALVGASFVDWKRLDGSANNPAAAGSASAQGQAPAAEPDPAPAGRPGRGGGVVPLDRATRGLVADPDPGRVASQPPVRPAGTAAPPAGASPAGTHTKPGTKPTGGHASAGAKVGERPAPRTVNVSAGSDVSNLSVEELVELLDRKAVAIRTKAMFELAKRGADAADALPKLKELAEDPALEQAAKFAIKRIENP